MHEHLLCDVTPPGKFAPGEPDEPITLENVWEIRYHWCESPGNTRLEDENIIVQELRELADVGMDTVVELTSEGMKRDPEGLLRVSQAADLHIVMGCGYYIEPFLGTSVHEARTDVIAAKLIEEIRHGVGTTGVRPGIIGEIGCSGDWTPLERAIMHAAVVAQQETGLCINVHPHRSSRAPYEIVSYIRECGGTPERTIISHIDRTIFDLPTLYELADTGCIIEYDFFGIESSHYPFQALDLPNDGMRLKAVRDLCDRGHLAQVVISQDICTKTRLRRFGGHGYTHIAKNVIPMMRSGRFSEDEITTIIRDTPRRLLSAV